jgi:hypothetical protein
MTLNHLSSSHINLIGEEITGDTEKRRKESELSVAQAPSWNGSSRQTTER